jgi:hypothetical protein
MGGEYMKKLTFIVMAMFLIFAISGCIFDGNEIEKGGVKTYPTKKFWAIDQSKNPPTYYQLTAEKLTENSRCVVWAEKGSGVTEEMAILIANEYANNIYTKMISNFGWEDNIPLYDNKGNIAAYKKMGTMDFAHALATNEMSGAKLTILLLDIKDGYKEGVNDSYVAGYFSSPDLFKNSDVIKVGYRSNELDMIYIDTYPGFNRNIKEVGTTLAHEMQHLMNYVSSYIYRTKDDKYYLMDLWIDEGLSSAAQQVYLGEHSMDRVDWFKLNGDGEGSKGKIDEGNNFYVWNNHESESGTYPILDDYATVYMFFQWLRLQSNSNIYKEIIKSENYDYQAVIKAFNKIKSSGSNYSNWESMLKDWLLANIINSTSGRTGYMDDPILKDIKAHYAPEGTTTLGLYPGEGVYSYSTSSPSVSNTGNIKYEYLDANKTLITYNVNTINFVDENTNINTLIEDGTATGVIPPAASIVITGSINLKQGASKISRPFPIGMGDIIRMNKPNNPHNFNGLKIERVLIDE